MTDRLVRTIARLLRRLFAFAVGLIALLILLVMVVPSALRVVIVGMSILALLLAALALRLWQTSDDKAD